MRRDHSIVPSLLTAPVSPARMMLLLVLASYGVGGVLALFTLLATPFVLALPGLDATAVFRVAVAQGIVAGLALVVVTLRGVRRMHPIYSALLYGPRSAAHEPPPNERAVRAAFEWRLGKHRLRPAGADRRRTRDLTDLGLEWLVASLGGLFVDRGRSPWSAPLDHPVASDRLALAWAFAPRRHPPS